MNHRFCDPLLPVPGDHSLDGGRRLNGRKKTNPENQSDYDEYCNLYRDYVNKRAPFWRKPEWIPNPGTGRVEGWEQRLQQVKQGDDTTLATAMEANRAAVQAEYRVAFAELVQAIETLSNCNYVHNFGGKATRIVALYDYQSHGGMDVVHDINSSSNWMFPTPGGHQVMEAQVTTRYFDQYVPERGEIVGPDPHSRVWLADREPLPYKHSGQAHELCLSINKHPNTAAWYSALLWAAVRGQ